VNGKGYAHAPMARLSWRWLWLLMGCALVACATAPPSRGECAGAGDEGETSSFEEACEEESSLLALCDGSQCGLYRCREVMKDLAVGRVVLARGGAVVWSNPQAEALRHRGSAQGLPQDTRPVFIIPWKHKLPLLPSQQQMLEEAAKARANPHEKHHIFPRMFREWFARQGIDIDEYVILLEVEKHRSIHRGPKGGRGMRRGISSSESTPSHDRRRRRSTGMPDSSSTSSSCLARSFHYGNSRHRCLRDIEGP
jgi:hypothetical protein